MHAAMSCLVNCGQQVGDRRADRGTAANKGIQTWRRHRQGTREETKRPHIQEGQRSTEQSNKETGQTVSKETEMHLQTKKPEREWECQGRPETRLLYKSQGQGGSGFPGHPALVRPRPHQTRQQVRGQRDWDGSPEPRHIPSSPWAPALVTPGQAHETHQVLTSKQQVSAVGTNKTCDLALALQMDSWETSFASTFLVKTFPGELILGLLLCPPLPRGEAGDAPVWEGRPWRHL